MTLRLMTWDDVPFMATCFMAGGQDEESAKLRAEEELEIALSLLEPTFFVGGTFENPTFFLGAYTDTTHRAYLTVGSIDLKAAPNFKDAHEWLSYLTQELGIQLIEAHVWVEDIKKEWYLRALGFKKAGIIPNKVDIPGRGSEKAIGMYLTPDAFGKVTRQSFHATMKQYKAHRNRLREERAAG